MGPGDSAAYVANVWNAVDNADHAGRNPRDCIQRRIVHPKWSRARRADANAMPLGSWNPSSAAIESGTKSPATAFRCPSTLDPKSMCSVALFTFAVSPASQRISRFEPYMVHQSMPD